MTPVTSTFPHAGRRLAYSTYGDGPRLTVLLHGLLFSRRMHEQIRGSELALLHGAGHLSNLEQPDAFNARLASFLAQRF